MFQARNNLINCFFCNCQNTNFPEGLFYCSNCNAIIQMHDEKYSSKIWRTEKEYGKYYIGMWPALNGTEFLYIAQMKNYYCIFEYNLSEVIFSTDTIPHFNNLQECLAYCDRYIKLSVFK